jgi:hypothetical protein
MARSALLLAAIGLYGLLAFSVAERRREIALRVALGAEPPAILRMVVGHGLKLVALGLTAGGLASFGVTRVLTSLLYQTDTHDPVTFAVVPAVLLLISLAACALPAMPRCRSDRSQCSEASSRQVQFTRTSLRPASTQLASRGERQATRRRSDQQTARQTQSASDIRRILPREQGPSPEMRWH